MTSAIIVAAGSSSRMGFDKLFADLAGKAVLRRTIGAFEACPAIAEIIVVSSAESIGRIEAWKPQLPKLARVAEGGAQRHLSVARGLAAVSKQADFIAVHDGARPLVTPDLIARCIEAAARHGAAAAARPVTETLKRARGDGTAGEGVDRTGLWAMETPQVARAGLLVEAFEKILADGLAVTDEVSALKHAGTGVLLVENFDPNIKITFPADLALAEAVLKSREGNRQPATGKATGKSGSSP